MSRIIHDWLNGMRGGEKVLEALLELYPDATIYTLFHERGKVSPLIESHRIVTSWLQSHSGNLSPLSKPACRCFLPRSNRCDLEKVRSRHQLEPCRGERSASPRACYTSATATRRCDTYGTPKTTTPGPCAARWSFALCGRGCSDGTAKPPRRVDHFIANSRFVRERIREYYGRDCRRRSSSDRHRILSRRRGTTARRLLSGGGRARALQALRSCRSGFNATGNAACHRRQRARSSSGCGGWQHATSMCAGG